MILLLGLILNDDTASQLWPSLFDTWRQWAMVKAQNVPNVNVEL